MSQHYIDRDELADMQRKQWEAQLAPKNVYVLAIAKWGEKAQTVKAVEELSELTKELCKVFCNQADTDHIAEEIADVEIMIEQLKRIYADENAVAVWKAKKLRRLWERVNDEQK